LNSGLVKAEFTADGPNPLWVADLTFAPTRAGFIFQAIVPDVWGRRIVGWAIGEKTAAELVQAALNMALQQRKPDVAIRHSEQLNPRRPPASPSASPARG
jgi:putative transposase